jgi:hypothetical protein
MLSRMRVQVLLLGSAVAVLVAACASSGGGGPTSSSSAPSASAHTSTPAASSAVAAGCDTAPWRSAPISASHQVSVPPVPVVTAVRVARHPECGYDRVVLDIKGGVPSYTVAYVRQVIADASGQTITMPGARYLLITLRPAQAHSDAGVATVTAGVRQPRYPALASWALAGDFESVVGIAMGLSGQLHIRTGELAGRIYIDIKE